MNRLVISLIFLATYGFMVIVAVPVDTTDSNQHQFQYVGESINITSPGYPDPYPTNVSQCF